MTGRAPTPPQADSAVAEAHEALREDGSIQFDLSAVEPEEPPAWIRELVQFIIEIAPALEIPFYILLGALGLWLLYLLARRFAGFELPWERSGGEADEAPWRPSEVAALRRLEEADRLAAEGLYTEGVHLLLFESVDELDERRPDIVRPASTGRDLAAHPAVPDRPRAALDRIVRAVERGLFAGRPLGGEDWRDCRSAYEQFAFGDGWAR